MILWIALAVAYLIGIVGTFLYCARKMANEDHTELWWVWDIRNGFFLISVFWLACLIITIFVFVLFPVFYLIVLIDSKQERDKLEQNVIALFKKKAP